MNDLQGDSIANSKKTKDGKLPAFQFYPGDWKRHPGLTSLSPAERWHWLELVMLMHDSKERGVLLLGNDPMPEEAVAMNLNLDNQTTSKLLTKLIAYGVATVRQEDGAICCDWMLRQENIRSIRRIAGLQGGNPNLLKQKSTTGDKQKITPSYSYSSSSSDQIQIHANSEQPPIEVQTEAVQLPLAQALPMVEALPTPKPAGRARKVKNKLTNLVDMTEAELASLGKHPSPLAPRHLTRKKEELEPQDDEAANARVWLTQSELERLREKWGDEKLFALIERASQYFGIQPAKAKDYADHNLLLQNWERR